MVLVALHAGTPEVLSPSPPWFLGHCSFQQLMPDLSLESDAQILTPAGTATHSGASIYNRDLCLAPGLRLLSALVVASTTLPHTWRPPPTEAGIPREPFSARKRRSCHSENTEKSRRRVPVSLKAIQRPSTR